jgi:aldose 1-epimerase
MTLRVAIAWDQWRAEVSPEIGGAILSLSRAGVPIMRPTPEDAVQARAVRRTAGYPLIPYANRVAYGKFTFGANHYLLRANFPASEHPLHGVGWRRPWQLSESNASSCELVYKHRPVDDEMEDWPFAFDATARFVVGADGLTVTQSIRNVHDTRAPAGIGLHSLFPRAAGQKLTFRSAGAWTNGPDMLPADRVAGGEWDFSSGQTIGPQDLDNDFVKWDGQARIDIAGRESTQLRASSVYTTLRVYIPPGRDFIGVEPVSHVADAINRPGGAGGKSEDHGDFAVLEPGAVLEGTVNVGVIATT